LVAAVWHQGPQSTSPSCMAGRNATRKSTAWSASDGCLPSAWPQSRGFLADVVPAPRARYALAGVRHCRSGSRKRRQGRSPRNRETVWQRMGEWGGIIWSNPLRPAIWRKTEVDTAKPTHHRRLGQSKPLGPARVYCGRQGPIWQCRPHRSCPLTGSSTAGT